MGVDLSWVGQLMAILGVLVTFIWRTSQMTTEFKKSIESFGQNLAEFKSGIKDEIAELRRERQKLEALPLLLHRVGTLEVAMSSIGMLDRRVSILEGSTGRQSSHDGEW